MLGAPGKRWDSRMEMLRASGRSWDLRMEMLGALSRKQDSRMEMLGTSGRREGPQDGDDGNSKHENGLSGRLGCWLHKGCWAPPAILGVEYCWTALNG